MDSEVDLGGVEVVEVVSGVDAMGEGAMGEVAAVLEVNAAAAIEVTVGATTVIEVTVGATMAIRMVLVTGADVGATVAIGRVVAAVLEAVLEAVVAVLEAVAAAAVVAVLGAISRVGNLGAETIDRGNRGGTAGMAIREVLKATEAVSIRRSLSVA